MRHAGCQRLQSPSAKHAILGRASPGFLLLLSLSQIKEYVRNNEKKNGHDTILLRDMQVIWIYVYIYMQQFTMAAEKRLGLLLAHALNCVACMHLRLEWGEIFKNHCHSHMGGSQNYGPLLGRHYITAPNIQGYQNGTLILGTPRICPCMLKFLSVRSHAFVKKGCCSASS